MMVRIMKHKILVLGIGIVLSAFAMAGCGADPAEQEDQAAPTEQTEQAALPDGTYEIQIRGDVDNEAAAELLALVNQYRSEQGLAALVWNDEPAELLRVRAAELAINLSETRLDGTPGEETLRGCLEGIEEGTEQILQDEEFVRLLQDPENTSFCAGVFQSYSGPIYVAAGIYAEAGTNDVPSPTSEERTFTLITKDEALNIHGQLVDQEMVPEDPKELYKGEGYYYCIINENNIDGQNGAGDIGDNEEELVGMYAESSDPSVVTIDEYGEVTAIGAGTATLTVRPAEASAIEFVLEVQVH